MSEMMDALVLHAVGDARVEAMRRPTPGAGEVLVRVDSCGVCGSDLPRIFVKGTYHFPTVCGHEFAGTVEAMGSGVEGLTQGDAVAVFPLIWCGRCEACERGAYAQCHDYDYLGSRSDGGFGQYVVAPAKNLVKVPVGVPLEVAAMTEPAAVALHALRRADCRAGDTVAVFGAGPIGLMVAQWVRVMGGDVAVFDIRPQALELANRLGIEHAYDTREVQVEQALQRAFGMDRVSLAVEGAGVPATFTQAIAVTRHGGRMVMLGNPSADVTLPASLISSAMRSEIDLVGTWNSSFSVHDASDDWRTTLGAMASGRLNLEPLITHRVGLRDAWPTLLTMRDGATFYSKVLVQPGA